MSKDPVGLWFESLALLTFAPSIAIADVLEEQEGEDDE